LRNGVASPITDAVRQDQHPLRREGLLRRTAPFLAIALLAFAAVPLSSQPLNPPALISAAALLTLIAGAIVLVPWDRLPPYAASAPPIAYFLVVALLVQTAGGGPSGYVPLVLLPIFWLALYGTRSELGIAMASGFVPVSFGPPSGWPSRGGDVAVSTARRPPAATRRAQ